MAMITTHATSNRCCRGQQDWRRRTCVCRHTRRRRRRSITHCNYLSLRRTLPLSSVSRRPSHQYRHQYRDHYSQCCLHSLNKNTNTNANNNKNNNNNSLILLDRDGVITTDIGSPGVTSANDLYIEPFAAEAIMTLNHYGHYVVIITNQSCVGKGLITADELDELHELMKKKLVDESNSSSSSSSIGGIDGASIDKIYAATETKSSSSLSLSSLSVERDSSLSPLLSSLRSQWRKPGAGMIIQAMNDFGYNSNNNDISSDSGTSSMTCGEVIMVGDTCSDMIAAAVAGVQQRVLILGNNSNNANNSNNDTDDTINRNNNYNRHGQLMKAVIYKLWKNDNDNDFIQKNEEAMNGYPFHSLSLSPDCQILIHYSIIDEFQANSIGNDRHPYSLMSRDNSDECDNHLNDLIVAASLGHAITTDNNNNDGHCRNSSIQVFGSLYSFTTYFIEYQNVNTKSKRK